MNYTSMIVGLVVSSGVGQVIGNVAKATLPANAKLITKVFTFVGSTAIGYVVGEQVGVYVTDKVQGIIDKCKSTERNPVEE